MRGACWSKTCQQCREYQLLRLITIMAVKLQIFGGETCHVHVKAQGPEEMCLSLEHQTRRKRLKKWVILIVLQFRYTFYWPQTKRLRARKIGLQYKIRNFSFLLLGTSYLGRPSGDVPCASEDRVTTLKTAVYQTRTWLAVIDFQKSI